jgi:hypothetical protein
MCEEVREILKPLRHSRSQDFQQVVYESLALLEQPALLSVSWAPMEEFYSKSVRAIQT